MDEEQGDGAKGRYGPDYRTKYAREFRASIEKSVKKLSAACAAPQTAMEGA